MTSKFLNSNGVDLSALQDGTFSIYAKSIKVNDLDPNMNVSADQNKFLNSTNAGSGNMNYTGATTATNKIYKASGATGLDAVASSITDDGTNCIVSATNGITANKIIKSGGTAIQYLMADGSVLTQSANSGNSNFYLYQNKDGITTPPPLAGDVGYDTVRQDEATFVYISHLTQDAIDIEVFFKQVNQFTG